MNYQQSNWLIDIVMPQVSGNAYKVIVLVARKTWGWQQQTEKISVTDFQEAMGVARATAASAIDEALASGFIRRVKASNSFSYSMSNVPDFSTVQKQERAKKQNDNSSDSSTTNVPEISTPPSYIKNKIKEQKEDRAHGPEVTAVPPGGNIDDYDEELIQMETVLGQVVAESLFFEEHRQRIREGGKALLAQGHTPEEVALCFGEGDTWWYTVSHGRKGEKPWVSNVVGSIATALNWRARGAPALSNETDRDQLFQKVVKPYAIGRIRWQDLKPEEQQLIKRIGRPEDLRRMGDTALRVSFYQAVPA